MVVLTKEERRRRVLELHDQGMGTREIAEIQKMSFRDIGHILRDADREKEVEEQQTQQRFLSSRAYKLYSAGKTSVQVAIDLNLRQPEATELYREYWNLVQLDNLNQIYKKIGHDIWFFVELYKSARAAGFRVQDILRLLRIANNDLTSLESRHQILAQEVKTMESEKRTSTIIFQDLTDQISYLHKICEDCQSSFKKEIGRMDSLYHKKMKLEALVKQFENNNQEYVKIRKTVEEKVLTTLSDRKGLLRLALLCLTQSMRNEPERYNSLIHYSSYSTSRPHYDASYVYGQQKDRSREDYMAMLVQEADKLYDKLLKDLADESIDDYSTPSRTSLPTLPPSGEL
jgi:hypothetical protein